MYGLDYLSGWGFTTIFHCIYEKYMDILTEELQIIDEVPITGKKFNIWLI